MQMTIFLCAIVDALLSGDYWFFREQCKMRIMFEEWTEWHLTPHGWEAGSYLSNGSVLEREIPPDRVQTCRSIERKIGQRYSTEWAVQWEIADKQKIAELHGKFGRQYS